jgi:PAS domain S-box-containing protein
MNYRLEELIDISLLQNLQDKLNVVYSFPSAIIDNDGKVLTAVAWQDICTQFHRKNPDCEKECIKSDQYILEHIQEANPAVSYLCPHGLIDNAAPIIIEGKHLGNFFTGQFFLEKPDLEFFKKQAKLYGFDEKEYLKAVEKVPVWTKEKLIQYLDFIKGFIEIIAGIGLNHLNEIRANRAIRAIEDRNRMILQSTSDWIWEIDDQGKYCYCSGKVEQILGFTPEEIIGKSPLDLMTPQERNRCQSILQNIVETKGSIIDLENWNLHKDGHLVCLLTNGFPVFDSKGEITGFRGADKDISERKQADQALKGSELKYRSLIESSSDAIFCVDENGEYKFTNQLFASTFGKTPDYFLGKTFHDIYDKEHADHRLEATKRLFQTGESESLEVEVPLPDRTLYFLARTNPIKDDSGRVVLNLTHAADITGLKQTERVLKDIIEKNPMSIQIVDKDGFTLQVNAAHTDLFGAVPPPDYSIFNDFQLKDQGFDALLEQVKAGEVVHFPDFHYNAHNVNPEFPDVPVWIRMVIFPLTGKSRIPERFVLMHENITRRKNSEQELIKAKERAEESDQLKSAFLANMSHEIRTPMNGILGFAELLKEPGLTGEDQQKYIAVIEKSGARMLNIINDIISISKIESGQMEIFVSKTNINEQMEFLFSFFKPEVEQKAITIRLSEILPLEKCIILTDREKVYAILTNLIKNAVKFTRHGSIEFGCRLVETDNYPSLLEFFVKDTGTGISPDQKNLIFERFRQGSEFLNRNYEGAGLGLSISKAYVEMLGGEIRVESESGKGSLFSFTIPYRTE